MKRTVIILAFTATFAIAACAQGFLNLNFESAQNLPGNPGGFAFVAVTNALPDWNADVSEMFYVSNTFSGAPASVGLEGGSLALDGNFSVGLYDGGAISQTGLVPDNAESLEFEAEGPGAGGSIESSNLKLNLGGQMFLYAELSELSEGPDYNVYGINIPASMDGQMETLTFSCQTGNVLLDDIQFSGLPTPEPGELALFGLGAILFYMQRFLTAKYTKYPLPARSLQAKPLPSIDRIFLNNS